MNKGAGRSLFFVLAVCVFILCCGELWSRDNGAPDKERKVKECLSRFAYGINEGWPEIALSSFCNYDIKSHDGEHVNVKSAIGTLLKDFRALKGERFVYISSIDIRWRDEKAYVECAMLWKAVARSEKRMVTWSTKDLFILEPSADSYCISMMAKTGRLMQSMGDVQTMIQLDKIDLSQLGGAK